MNCAEANRVDIVDYLCLSGHQPAKIKNNDYWYLSPLRQEKDPSFKINRSKNVWYDHGLGKGGKLLDFVMEYYHCKVSQALEKISSFHGQKQPQTIPLKQPRHQHESKEINKSNAPEMTIKIIAAKRPITDFSLCSCLKKRRIAMGIANEYCHEVSFAIKNKNYKVIGFKNNAGGYELRNGYFKGSSSPKYISYLDNNAGIIAVFEGFFDFLSYQSIYQNQQHEMTNFLVLNSLALLERSLLLMEKHTSIKLYLNNDDARRRYTSIALKRFSQFQDKSKLYKGYKDLNDWVMNIGKANKQRQSFTRHL